MVPLLVAYGVVSWAARAGVHLVCYSGTWAAVARECAFGPGTIAFAFSMSAVVSWSMAVRNAWRLVAGDAERYDLIWEELIQQPGAIHLIAMIWFLFHGWNCAIP